MTDWFDEELYREVLMDHYQHPRNKSAMEGADLRNREVNPLCGDEVEMFAKVSAEGGLIEAVSFEGDGCAISQAAASMLTEVMPGKSLAELHKMESADVMAMLGVETVGAQRMKCAMLALRALQRAAVEAEAASGSDGEKLN